jgi:hypothetical protein
MDLKLNWPENEMRDFVQRILKIEDQLRYYEKFYDHPALQDVMVNMRVTRINVSTLREICQNRYDYKMADPQSGDYGYQWYCKPSK